MTPRHNPTRNDPTHGEPVTVATNRRTVWLLWDCADLVAAYDTEHDAQEARADLQHQLLCAYGPDIQLLESITVTPAAVHANDPATIEVSR